MFGYWFVAAEGVISGFGYPHHDHKSSLSLQALHKPSFYIVCMVTPYATFLHALDYLFIFQLVLVISCDKRNGLACFNAALHMLYTVVALCSFLPVRSLFSNAITSIPSGSFTGLSALLQL